MTTSETEVAQAAARFRRLIGHCVNLIEIHRDVGGGERGGRGPREQSLNRATIVLAVAAWQTAAQDLATLALESGLFGSWMNPGKDEKRMLEEIEQLSSPTPERVSSLLSDIGVEPVSAWAASTKGRPKKGVRSAQDLEKFLSEGGRGRRNELRRSPRDGDPWSEVLARPVSRLEMDVAQWVRLRHAIAHGESRMPRLDVLGNVRVYRSKLASTMSGYVSYAEGPEDPKIRLLEARNCVRDISNITYLTAMAIHDEALRQEQVRTQEALQVGAGEASKRQPMDPLARMAVKDHWMTDLARLKAAKDESEKFDSPLDG